VSLHKAKEYAEEGKYADAWRIVTPYMMDKPDDPMAMMLAGYMLEKQGQAPIAYHVCKSLTAKHPSFSGGWANLGKVCDTLWRMDEAEAAYNRALNQTKAGDTDAKLMLWNNLAALHLQLGNFDKARKYAERSLDIDREHLKARHNLGISLLAAGEWAEGWRQYEASVGSSARIAWNYTGEPTWKGEPGGTVVIFGEQGIGDEICAASMIPDAIEVAGKVIIDCDVRLQGLFARSFPRAKVYGTRNQKVLNWADEDQTVDYSIASMQCGGLFRNSAAAFPGKPFLTADPDRVLMWRALWASKGKPAIGIAWSGGIRETASMHRRWSHEELAQIMRAKDAHWVCLQYKDAAAEVAEFRAKYPDIDIGLYQATTLSKDYDDMAGLVASLDGVVAMQSTAVHTAGALGIPCAAGIPKTSQWRYGTQGSKIPWYASVRLFRQTDQWPIGSIRDWVASCQ
jgi:tetratricopeptide (TPR) repeat protein